MVTEEMVMSTSVKSQDFKPILSIMSSTAKPQVDTTVSLQLEEVMDVDQALEESQEDQGDRENRILMQKRPVFIQKLMKGTPAKGTVEKIKVKVDLEDVEKEVTTTEPSTVPFDSTTFKPFLGEAIPISTEDIVMTEDGVVLHIEEYLGEEINNSQENEASVANKVVEPPLPFPFEVAREQPVQHAAMPNMVSVRSKVQMHSTTTMPTTTATPIIISSTTTTPITTSTTSTQHAQHSQHSQQAQQAQQEQQAQDRYTYRESYS